jgi:hypothetical protein
MAGIASRPGVVHPGEQTTNPMATTDEQNTFRIFLRLLSVTQFALAMIAATGLGLVFMLHRDAAARAANPNRAAELNALQAYRPAFIFLATVSVVALVGGLISGVCIWRKRGRRFSQFIAVVGLLLFPIGTAIGLATLIVLGQKPIRDLYKV